MRLTLDQLEAEQEDREPFEVELGDGVVVSLPHPQDLPFQSLIEFDGTQPAAVLRSLLGDGFEKFASNPRITLRTMTSILEKYYQHFGLGDHPEGSASPVTSTGTARPSKPTSGSRRKAKAS